MRGGYAAAEHWNRHFADMEKRFAAELIAMIDADPAEVRRAESDAWSVFYDWIMARPALAAAYKNLSHYSAGAPYAQSEVFRHWQSVYRRVTGE